MVVIEPRSGGSVNFLLDALQDLAVGRIGDHLCHHIEKRHFPLMASQSLTA